VTGLANELSVERTQNIGLKIKCYKVPASLRGRIIDDDLLVLGVYTYDRGRSSTYSIDKPQIWGAPNPVVVTFRNHPHGKTAADWFNEVFARLWRDASPLQEALSDPDPDDHIIDHNIDPDWLHQVSTETD